MLNDATLRNFEDRFQLVQSKAKDTVQSAHCALDWMWIDALHKIVSM